MNLKTWNSLKASENLKEIIDKPIENHDSQYMKTMYKQHKIMETINKTSGKPMVFDNKSSNVIRIIQFETQLIYEQHMQYNIMKTNANIH